MVKQKLYVIQEAGMGDVFFLQKLIKTYAEQYDVYHRINPNIWNHGAKHLITHPSVTHGPQVGAPEPGAVIYNGSDQWNGKGLSKAFIMSSKYEGVGMVWEDWADYLLYERNHDAEMSLFHRLNPNDEPYILANKQYGFRKEHHGVSTTIPEDYDGHVIWMNPSISTNYFDWCYLIENAEQIHSVDTSINYLIDTLDLKTDQLYCHPRHYIWTQQCIEKLCKTKWTWVQYSRDEWRRFVPGESE